MCGEDLAGYRSSQAKLLILGLGICVFLAPSFFINWAFGRFDNYIADTFFDWPSYLISFACWAALAGGILYLRANKPRSPSREASLNEPKEAIPPEHRPEGHGLGAAEPGDPIAQGLDYIAGKPTGGILEIAQLKSELAALESKIEAERVNCRRAMQTITLLIEADYAPPTKGTMIAFGWTDAAETVRDFVRQFPQMSEERSRIWASIELLSDDSA